MGRLLLNAQSAKMPDEPEESEGLESRVIYEQIDLERGRDSIIKSSKEHGKIKGPENLLAALGEYFLDEFVARLQGSLAFDRVAFLENEPGAIQEKGGIQYTFSGANGRRIIVSDAQTGRGFTEICRVLDLRRNGYRQVVIADLKLGKNAPIKQTHFLPRCEAIRKLLGQALTLSYMTVYPSDTFRALSLVDGAARSQTGAKYSFIERYLHYNPRNLVMVYSADSERLFSTVQEIYHLAE